MLFREPHTLRHEVGISFQPEPMAGFCPPTACNKAWSKTASLTDGDAALGQRVVHVDDVVPELRVAEREVSEGPPGLRGRHRLQETLEPRGATEGAAAPVAGRHARVLQRTGL